MCLADIPNFMKAADDVMATLSNVIRITCVALRICWPNQEKTVTAYGWRQYLETKKRKLSGLYQPLVLTESKKQLLKQTNKQKKKFVFLNLIDRSYVHLVSLAWVINKIQMSQALV